MTNQQPPELFAERPVRSDYARVSRGINPTALAAVALLVAIAIGGIYFASKSQQQEATANGNVPIIKAEGVYKTRPEQPGGIDIPHQDMQVYQAIESGDSTNPDNDKPKVERLMPPPEQPMAAALEPAKPTETIPVASVQLAQAEPEEVAPPAAVETKVEPALPTAASVNKANVQKPAALPPEPVVPESAVSAEKPALPKPIVSGSIPKDLLNGGTGRKNFYVQLASINNETAAQNELKKLQTKYAGQLGGTKLRLVRADLGAKGVYYRIQSEGLAPDAASKICAGLWSQKGQCIIVKP